MARNETRLNKLEQAGGAGNIFCVFVDWGEGDETESLVVLSDGTRERMTLGEFKEQFPDETIIQVNYVEMGEEPGYY